MRTRAEIVEAMRAAKAAGNQAAIDRLITIYDKTPPDSSAERTGEALMNPGQTVRDLTRTASNFITLGGTDRIRPWLEPLLGGKEQTYEEAAAETEAADYRTGTMDEALNLGAAFMQPMAATGYVPQATKVLPQAIQTAKQALGFGAENAAYGGIESVIKGEDVPSGMATGGAFGFGGKLLGDVVSGVRNLPGIRNFVGDINRPLYKDQAELDRAFVEEGRGRTRVGKDLLERQKKSKVVEEAQGFGKPGFDKLNKSVGDYAFSRAEAAKIAALADKSKTQKGLEITSEALKGGKSLPGRIGATLTTGGVAPLIGATIDSITPSMGKGGVNAAKVEELQNLIRNPDNQDLANNPAVLKTLRDAMAKLMAGYGRDRPAEGRR